MNYKSKELSIPITFTKPATVSRWVWVWKQGWFKVRGWSVVDRTLLKVKVEREMRIDDYIYGLDGMSPIGLAKLYCDGTRTGL